MEALRPWFLRCFGMCMAEEVEKHQTFKDVARPIADWKAYPIIQDYTLLKQVGKGGFSHIWLAERKGTGERVAIKVVQLANADLEPDEVATLLAEAKFLRSLDCPFLLHCHAAAATADHLVLVLEYLGGGEMLDHLHRVKRYTEVEAAALFAQVVSAISYLHNLNLMHRDIKPENVMFVEPVEEAEAAGRPLRVKVIDLGMAALYDPDKPTLGCVGTPGFVAPEAWHDKPHTPAADVYALGAVLFIMLTGRKPHAGADIRKMTYCDKPIAEAPGLQDERFLALSPAARDLILAMLADDPLQRPTCAAVLRHAFITAVDTHSAAQREMGDVVRRRMRDLAQLRRLHGLRYAMSLRRPADASHADFLRELDLRRLKIKAEQQSHGYDYSTRFARPSHATGPFARDSLWMAFEDGHHPSNPASYKRANTPTAAAPATGPSTAAGYVTGGDATPGGADGGGGTGANTPNIARTSLAHRDTGGLSRASFGSGAGGGHGSSAARVTDSMALLTVMPEMHRANTIGHVHVAPLSPVPSGDPSMYGAAAEEAKLQRAWSAFPPLYEALEHTAALMDVAAHAAALQLPEPQAHAAVEMPHQVPLPETPPAPADAGPPAAVPLSGTVPPVSVAAAQA